MTCPFWSGFFFDQESWNFQKRCPGLLLIWEGLSHSLLFPGFEIISAIIQQALSFSTAKSKSIIQKKPDNAGWLELIPDPWTFPSAVQIIEHID
jgi:hypothetical protein